MRSGDRPGLQNRRAAGLPVVGGFDPHSLPPIFFNHLNCNCTGFRPAMPLAIIDQYG
jgi:hypothetical protein